MTKQGISRRRFLKGLGAAGGAMLLSSQGNSPGLADQGHCPQVAGKAVRWIIPTQSGGTLDTYSRLIARFYEEKLGAKIVINYVPGAGTIRGAKVLQEAPPDGLTMGMIGAPGLLVAALTGETEAPNPAKDFTIIARVSRSPHVWATSGSSPFKTINDVLAEAKRRPILFGITEVGTSFFVDVAVTSFLLGINAEFVAGYLGGRACMLAAVRGEVDLIAFPFESVLSLIEAEDLRPILQVSVERISTHPSLEGVPLLGGDKGLVSLRAAELGRDLKQAQADAVALAGLIGGGRMVAAPLGLDKDLFQCLEQRLYEALTQPDFKAAAAKARLSLDVARADVAFDETRAAAERAEKFMPIIKAAIEKVQR